MGVEIELFPMPTDWPVLPEILTGKQPGYLLQHMGSLFSSLRDGEPGEEWLEDLSFENEPASYKEALYLWFHEIKKRPHLLGIYFDGASRGHDHWAYLLELSADNDCEKELGRSTIFGSQVVHENAIAGQGRPIRWSTCDQVKKIQAFISNRDNASKTEARFAGFPKDRPFYKRRNDDSFQGCMYELGQIREFYNRAADLNLACFCILD